MTDYNSSSNLIDPSAIIRGKVTLGSRNVIGPNVVMFGPLTVGDNNIFEVGAVIGTPGENTRDPRQDVSDKPIVIGDDCIFKEYTVVQKPCFGDITSVGNRVFMMHGAHVAHDCIIEDDVVLTPMVALAGLVTIQRGANLAMSCQVHQRSVVGAFSIIAMGASLLKNLKPFARYIPGRPLSVNEYAIEKFNFSDYREEIVRYVLEQETPKSPILRDIVERFDKLDVASGRKSYR